MSGKCSRCGSAKIVPEVPLLDHFGDLGGWSKNAEVHVHGDPNAWIFRDTVVGNLVADICGDCGHADVRVPNASQLYEKYARTMGI